ncbi:MAG: hypothetical protein EI684_13405 [Candidatus Viridilinea halotolerans]|uniref:Uncharacterized protein n=1 Tax=Candidatus Viridilinea halotolerans TaxID=2491704 RepID=A0A426TXE5_9CHLR|nr:MAG: hypothetical protein EI684_13405 [Candidatus Viridilinea halotolerans]
MQAQRILPLCTILLFIVIGLPPRAAATQPQPPGRPGLFGFNMYITGRERSAAEATQLVAQAQALGARWSREEICWACWGRDEAKRSA